MREGYEMRSIQFRLKKKKKSRMGKLRGLGKLSMCQVIVWKERRLRVWKPPWKLFKPNFQFTVKLPSVTAHNPLDVGVKLNHPKNFYVMRFFLFLFLHLVFQSMINNRNVPKCLVLINV